MNLVDVLVIFLLIVCGVLVYYLPQGKSNSNEAGVPGVILLMLGSFVFLCLSLKNNIREFNIFNFNQSNEHLATASGSSLTPSKNTIKTSKKDKNTYNISTVPMSELDGISIDEIAQKRKRYAEKNSDIIEDGYEFSKRLVTERVSNKNWWGINALLNGNGQTGVANAGLSLISSQLNNPLLLFALETRYISTRKNTCDNCWPEITSFTYNPSEKTFNVYYNVSSFDKKMKKTMASGEKYSRPIFELSQINAFDFGYNFSHVFKHSNLSLTKRSDGEFQSLYTGFGLGDCYMSEKCAGARDAQYEIEIERFPAKISIGLYKKKPKFASNPDIIFNMVFY